MKKWVLVVSLVYTVISLTFLLGQTPSSGLEEPEPQPAAFYGTIAVDGQPVRDGSFLEARINGVTVGSILTGNGTYGNGQPLWEKLLVHGRYEDEGLNIVFILNGVVALETVPFVPGSVGELNLSFSAGPELTLSSNHLEFSAEAGGEDPGVQEVSVSNMGGGVLQWSVVSDSAWLAVNPGSGSGDGVLGISVSTAGLAAGSYNGTVTVSNLSVNPTISETINITLNLEEFHGTVLGSVRLEGTLQDYTDPVTRKVRVSLQSSSNYSYMRMNSLSEVGFSIGIPEGIYDLTIESQGFLTRKLTGLVVDSQHPSVDVGRVLLLNSDLTGNNWVELEDLQLLRLAYGTAAVDPVFEPLADLDWDGRVGLVDLVLLARNFGREGDGGKRVMIPTASPEPYRTMVGAEPVGVGRTYNNSLEVTLRAGPTAVIYYTLGTDIENTPEPVPGTEGTLVFNPGGGPGTPFLVDQSMIIKAKAVEASWGGVSQTVTFRYVIDNSQE